ncbi:hypothetical protein C0993_000518 [Termitomyces sp. T159_Od127]|nr:hypothetical protein C0993_000518 [Termitomyces sp. T159_Od127]
MFHYIPAASYSYVPPHFSDFRDRYFAALAVAKAARADHLAAEAAQREEDNLRCRLAEIQYRKEEQILRSCYHLAPYIYPQTYPSYDRLAIPRQQLEEAECHRLLALREAELLKRREQVVMELEVAYMRRAREEAIRLKQEKRNKACLQALLGQSVKVAEHPCFCAHQEFQPYRCHEPREHTSSALYPSQRVLGFKPKVIAPVEPVVQTMQEGEAIEALLKHILGLTSGTSIPNASARMTTPKPSATVSEPKAAQDKDVFGLQKYFEHLYEPNGLSLDQFRPLASQATPATDPSFEHCLFQEFTKLLVPPVVQETANKLSASSCSSRPAQDAAEQDAPAASASAPAAPKISSNISTQSLKEQLEARLNNEFHSEVRDTIQAIFESLRDADNHGRSASVSSSSKVTSSSKGKARDEPIGVTSAPSFVPTSKNVVDSFNEVRSIEAAFHTLQADFAFPATLDFVSSHLIPGNSATSDSESSSLTSHLAYTSRNYPVRFYEQALGALLAQLDSIDSFGNDDLRATRKEVVNRVEKALEELEKEVDGRYRTRLAKEVKSLPVETTIAPESSTTITSASSDLKQELSSDLELVVGDIKESPSALSASSKPAPTATLESSLEISEPGEISGLITCQPTPTTPPSILTISDPLSLSSSFATVKGSEVQAEGTTQVTASPCGDCESPDAFLLTTDSEVTQKRPNNKDGGDVASDWSEVEP